MAVIKHWLSPKEASPVIGDDVAKIHRDIRLKQFPFEYVKCGRRIKISARSLGLLPADSQKDETRNQESLQATA